MTVLNLQVGAGGNDGISWSTTAPLDSYNSALGGLGAGEDVIIANSTREEACARFTGVSGLSGAVINTATYSVYGFMAGVGSPKTKLRAERAASPAQVGPNGASGGADFLGRTLTTAGVDWDAALTNDDWNASPDIASVIQEIADNFDPDVIQVFHKDDSSGAGNAMIYDEYDTDSALAPKLDIDYTAATAGLIARSPARSCARSPARSPTSQLN